MTTVTFTPIHRVLNKIDLQILLYGFVLLAVAFLVLYPMLLVFLNRDISHIALLATHSSRTLALLQLDFMVAGQYEKAAVVATLVVILTTGGILLTRLFGLRWGNLEGNRLCGELGTKINLQTDDVLLNDGVPAA